MIMDAVSWFDLVVVALVLVLGIKGLLNGFIKEIFGIIGLIGGVIVASRYASEVGELISKNIYAIAENFWFHIGFLITLIVFWVVCLGLGQIFNKILKMSGFSFLDRLLGFIVGSAKIFLVFAIFVFIISRIAIINEKIEPYSKKSFLYPFLLTAGELISKNIYAIAENFWFHIGFLITLIVFWVVCLGLGQIFNKILKMSGFSFLDRLLGFIVGSAKIFLVFAIFVFIISRIAIINEKIEPYSKKSFLYPFLLTAGEFIMNQNIPAVSEAKKISETATQNIKQEVQKAIADELNASINEANATLNIEPLNLEIIENNASGL